MKYRTMGKLGIRSSAFGLGCMRFNGPASGDSIIDEQKAISLIRRAIDGGVNYIDTAYVYLDKTSEIVLGKALLDGYRDKVTIATKVPPDMVHSRADLEKVLAEELGKLQTDHIDFYLMHALNRQKYDHMKEIGAREFFDDMKREGKIWIRVFPDKPYTKKPAEVRMGKGKGNPEGFVAPITPGRMIIEAEGVPMDVAKEALRLGAQKLPVTTKFVVRRDYVE